MDVPDARVVSLTAGNIEVVLDLVVRPEQGRWVRPVSWYVARSAYENVWTPVAITVEGGVVGFAEWAYDDSDATHCIGGVVVDARHQGKGYGKAGMRALVAHLRQRPNCGVIALTVHQDNVTARGLYRSLGFVETGERDGDELVMVLPPKP
jgi:diamine N-acetyltransferase